MMNKLQIQDFDKIYDLMQSSFPSDEYRTCAEQKALLCDPAYSIYASFNETREVLAFIAVWDFNDFAFIEHFAVNPQYRNSGLGSLLLKELLEKIGKTVCLEVESPLTEMANRRIGFYKRNNFFLNKYPYVQPAISRGKKALPLFIMTSGSKITRSLFERIKNTLHTKVYKQNRS